jgi:hypothetical protein
MLNAIAAARSKRQEWCRTRHQAESGAGCWRSSPHGRCLRLPDPARINSANCVLTEHWHHVALLGASLLRMKSWQISFMEPRRGVED